MTKPDDPGAPEHPDHRHARACVSFALVTSTPVAAELIDKAVGLRRAAPARR